MKKEVISFIEKIRGKNPDAKIIWAYGMLGQDADYIDGQMKELLKSAVDEYVKNTGDKEAYYLQLPVTEADGFGSRSHPGHKSHQNASECLVKMIRGLGY